MISPLKGKRICFSEYYEERQFRETLALLKFIYHNGGSYTFRSSACNIFVCPPEGVECARFENVKKSTQSGKKVLLLTKEGFLKMNDLTEEKVKSLPLPNESEFKNSVPQVRSFQSGNSSTKIGDVIQKAFLQK